MRMNGQPDELPEPIQSNDARFAQLREEHPDWYVANCGASWKLHRARCSRQAPTNGILWTSYEKVCGPDRADVENWVQEHRQHTLTECAFCLGAERH
jgi:hypothetical protein